MKRQTTENLTLVFGWQPFGNTRPHQGVKMAR